MCMTEEVVSCEKWPKRLDGPNASGKYTCPHSHIHTLTHTHTCIHTDVHALCEFHDNLCIPLDKVKWSSPTRWWLVSGVTSCFSFQACRCVDSSLHLPLLPSPLGGGRHVVVNCACFRMTWYERKHYAVCYSRSACIGYRMTHWPVQIKETGVGGYRLQVTNDNNNMGGNIVVAVFCISLTSKCWFIFWGQPSELNVLRVRKELALRLCLGQSQCNTCT